MIDQHYGLQSVFWFDIKQYFLFRTRLFFDFAFFWDYYLYMAILDRHIVFYICLGQEDEIFKYFYLKYFFILRKKRNLNKNILKILSSRPKHIYTWFIFISIGLLQLFFFKYNVSKKNLVLKLFTTFIYINSWSIIQLSPS